MVRAKESPEIRAGFGEGTLSPSGAALKTLDVNLRNAEQLVPTVEELRERARIAQVRREEAAVDSAPVEFRQPERVRPEASPAVRNFVQEDAQSIKFKTSARETEAAPSAPPEASPAGRNAQGTRLNIQA